MRVRKINSNDIKIHDSVQVKLKTAGNTSVVQFTAGNNKTCSVVNLSKDTYLDKKTGEVKIKKKSESRYQSPKSVCKSINRDTAPFIENEMISELWNDGVTSTHKVFDGDGLALYFKVYLSDIEYEDDNDEDAENTDKPATVEKLVDGVSKQS